MNKTLELIASDSSDFCKIFTENLKEQRIDKDEIILKISNPEYTKNKIVVHDLKLDKYGKNIYKIQDIIGSSWTCYFAQGHFDILEEQIDLFDDIKMNDSKQQFRFDTFIEEQHKFMNVGEIGNYERYVPYLHHFYNFLKVQLYPDVDTLKELNLKVDYMDEISLKRLKLALSMYSGFVVCSEIETEDYNIENMNLMEFGKERILPFPLITYLLKRDKISNLKISKLYIAVKKKFKFKKENTKIEKMFNVGYFSNRSNLAIQLYTKYYFLLFANIYFDSQIIGLDMNKKEVFTFEPDIINNYFSEINLEYSF